MKRLTVNNRKCSREARSRSWVPRRHFTVINFRINISSSLFSYGFNLLERDRKWTSRVLRPDRNRPFSFAVSSPPAIAQFTRESIMLGEIDVVVGFMTVRTNMLECPELQRQIGIFCRATGGLAGEIEILEWQNDIEEQILVSRTLRSFHIVIQQRRS